MRYKVGNQNEDNIKYEKGKTNKGFHISHQTET